MVTDDDLVKISQEFDSYFIYACERHGIAPLSYSGVILARLMRLNESNDDFLRLAREVFGVNRDAEKLH